MFVYEFIFRIVSSSPVNEAIGSQTLSQSLSVPCISVTSEITELTPVSHLEPNSQQTEDRQFLCVPIPSAQTVVKENVAMKDDNVCLIGTPIKLRVPSKVQSSSSSQLLHARSPMACSTKFPNNINATNIANSDIFTVPKSPKLKRAEIPAGVVDSRVKRENLLTIENLKIKSYGQEMVPQEKEVPSANSSPRIPKNPSSSKLQASDQSPVLRRGRSLSCLSKVSNGTSDVNSVINNVSTRPRSPQLTKADTLAAMINPGAGRQKQAHKGPRSPQLKRADTLNAMVDPGERPKETHTEPRSPQLKRTDTRNAMVVCGEKIQNDTQTETLKVQAFEQQIFSLETKIHCVDGPLGNPMASSSPKLQSTRLSPLLQRGRSLSCLTNVSNDASGLENSNMYSGSRSPKLNRAKARPVTGDPWINEHGALQEQNLGCGEGPHRFGNKGRSLSIPSFLKPEREKVNYKTSPGIETELQESQVKTGFADVRNHMSRPVNHLQSRRHLSIDDVPFQRRSTGNIPEALQTCAQESQPECELFERTESARDFEIKPPYEVPAEQTIYAQMSNSSRVDRGNFARPRASSMPKIDGSSDDKRFANLAAFNFKAQLSAFNKPVKFREISEPKKKSKWFHALSHVVPMSQFHTAMLEIQKQQEREKALEELQPSMATSFERIKSCRYLRIPERYEVKNETFQSSSGD